VMTKQMRITKEGLSALVEDLRQARTQVIGPARVSDGAVEYRRLADLADWTPGVQPRRSLKEWFLPVTEPLFRYRKAGPRVLIEELAPPDAPRVVLGAYPCDAAALPILDAVMGWDYRDEPWFTRREATVVISQACPGGDRSCFCTAMGLGPDSAAGADLLIRAEESGWVVEVHTAKGDAFVQQWPRHFQPIEGDRNQRPAQAPRQGALQVNPERVRAWIESHFEDPFWQEVALRCHGCGGCAAVCPTCHCFDIVDEPENPVQGARRRNWDTCQTALFTRHASGHNPREDQCGRCRQRVNHKFAIYPARFGRVLCTGCGRCARTCPSGQDITEILSRIDQWAAGPGGA